MLEVIKRKKLENLVLNILIILLVVTAIIINNYSSKQFLLEENYINSKETFNSISKSKKYVSIDLTNAKLTRFSLLDKENKKVAANTYLVSFDDEEIIVFLSPNTALTSKVQGKIIQPNKEQFEILSQLEKENKTIIEACISNMDYYSFGKYYNKLYIIAIIIISLSIIFSIFDILYYIYPKKTHKYKKYLKKQQKAIYK